ncbi:ferritin-like domain-containing protein [Paenibacillus chondroitinus]|uniref:Ferritin-like domain-containing protein n=1 Tax=Paenibacillus chondroitinus TaxID=59842 RepID=A0ABU6DGY8_9BACL|nr:MULTISPECIES: ferritin-like domain-containing protein [Paenibacillus]MCY9659624.1 ferritin-like domain-containing protein [Paenibacillus anseongense]MEB4797020.1 ferritin-like domain-containing protein [Paenibacillus chondroitinus]
MYYNLQAPTYVPFQGYLGYFARSEDMVLKVILQSISGERNDELFYQELIQLAPTEKEKEVIRGIRDDERKHNQMFRNIYTQLTGTPPTGIEATEPIEHVSNYLSGIESALFGELKAFEKYRTLYLNISPLYRDMIFEIMTDEIKHASYYNWLYAKNNR